MEDVIIARGGVDRTLRTNHIRLRGILIEVDGVLTLGLRHREEELRHDRAVSCLLLLAVRRGPDVAVVVLIPGGRHVVGVSVLLSVEGQIRIKGEVELHAGSALVVGDSEVCSDLLTRLHRDLVGRARGVVEPIRHKVVDDRICGDVLRGGRGGGRIRCLTDNEGQPVEHIIVARGSIDRTLRANHIRLRGILVEVDRVGAVLVRHCEEELRHDRAVCRGLLLAVRGGPDIAVIILVPCRRHIVGVAVLLSVEGQVGIKAEIELHARGALVVGNGQVRGDLLPSRDIDLVGRAGSIGQTVRNEIVNDRACGHVLAAGGIGFSCRGGNCIADDECQPMELKVIARSGINRTLRANHIRLRGVFVEVDGVRAVLLRHGEDELRHGRAVRSCLLLAVRGRPYIAVISLVPRRRHIVGVAVLLSVKGQVGIKAEIELHTGSTLVIGNGQVDSDLLTLLDLDRVGLACGVVLSVGDEVVNDCTLCFHGSGRLHSRCFFHSPDGCRGKCGKHSGGSHAEGRQCRKKSLHHVPFLDNVRGSGSRRAHQPLCLLSVILLLISLRSHRLPQERPSRSAVRGMP